MTLTFRRWWRYGPDSHFQLLMSNSISWVGAIKQGASLHSSRSMLRSPKAFASLCSRNTSCASASPSLTLLITSIRATCRIISAARASGSSSIAWEHPCAASSRFSSRQTILKIKPYFRREVSKATDGDVTVKRKTSIPGSFRAALNLLHGAALIGVVFVGANAAAQPRPAAAPDISIPAVQASTSQTTPQPQQPEPRAARLRVVVTDARQHSLPGATCSLIDSRKPTAIVATAVTNEEGIATFTALPSGSYSLRVENKDFETIIKSGIAVKDGSLTDINVILAVESLAASVT